jgi:ubiquinone biosynthesis O-methyltransferase
MVNSKVNWDGREWYLDDAISHAKKLAEQPGMRILETITLVAGTTILDIGCGAGITSYLIAKKLPMAKVLGVDLNPDAIKIAEAAFKLPNLSFQNVAAEKLAFEKKTFDCILFLEIIEHIENPGLILDTCHKLLKTGGTLIVSTPNALGYELLVRNLRSINRIITKVNSEAKFSGTQTDHILMWDFQTLYRLLTRKGFQYVAHWRSSRFGRNMLIKVKKV